MKILKFLLMLVLTSSWLLTGPGSSTAAQAAGTDPLPSWNEGRAKGEIIKFVEAVAREGGPDYVPPEERIAVFDNDGTLWSEQPVYFQLFFALDRVKALAPEHPEWKTTQPFKAVLENDMKTFAASGEKGILEIVAATHTGMTTDEFADLVKNWIAEARHPRSKQSFTAMVFQPMLEVLDYLRANGFRTYIISGGGIEFMRPWTGEAYGIPPEQVLGSSVKTEFEMKDGQPVLVRLAEIDFINDKAGKPVGINRFYRPASHSRLWQFRRRPADASMDRRRRRSAV